MIPCPSDEQLRHWLEGGLDEAADQALADHVDTCVRCQQILDQLTTVGPRPASLPRKGAEEQPGNEKSPTQNDLRPMRSLFSDTALYDGPVRSHKRIPRLSLSGGPAPASPGTRCWRNWDGERWEWSTWPGSCV